MYSTKELEHEHEAQLCDDFGPVFFLTDFPQFTSPFWNMARNDAEFDLGTSKKVDVIIAGQETMGSAERSCDPEEMRHQFYTISDGDYAKTLFAAFTKERVESELEQFLKFKFFPRSGGGIGVTRLIKGLEDNGLLEEDKNTDTKSPENEEEVKFTLDDSIKPKLFTGRRPQRFGGEGSGWS
jgi:aspartyl/asparaginyl-tRNA synthetase